MKDRFRKEYTTLTEAQKELGANIKNKAEELSALYERALRRTESFPDLYRPNLEKAFVDLESSVMFAIKAIYTGKGQTEFV